MTDLTSSVEKPTWLSRVVQRIGLRADIAPIIVFLAGSLAAGLLVNTVFPVNYRVPTQPAYDIEAHNVEPSGDYICPECVQMLIKYGGAVLVDVRGPVSFSQEHIAGAINIPYRELFDDAHLQYVSEVTSKGLMIFYCGAACGLSKRTVAHLRELGYENIVAVPGSISEWKQAGLATERGAGKSRSVIPR